MAVLHCIRANASKSRFLIALLLVMGSLTLTACGGDGGGTSNTSLSEGGGSGSSGSASGGDDETTTTTGVKIGNGTGAAFSEGRVGVDDATLQAGGTTTVRVNFVDLDNNAYSGIVDFELTSNCFANGLATFGESEIESNAGGYGFTTYTANGCSGDDEIVATATVDEQELSASVTVTVEADQVLGLTYEGASSNSLSLAGTGGTETTTLTFRLVGAQGASIVGEQVTFSIQGDEGGAILAPGTESDISDNSGEVTTVLQSGTAATNIRVTATHATTLETATSEGIVISSGLPIRRSFSISQTTTSPFAAQYTDGIEVEVNILAADQFGNRITSGTNVNFYAECGVIEPSCSINEESRCTVLWYSNTENQTEAANRCSILAFTEGVETFDDLNGNFVYESSDNFDLDAYDLPEPWLDSNESGEFETGELFVDTATGTKETYDGPNGLWDGLCLSGSVPNANCDGDDSAVIFNQALILPACNYVVVTPNLSASGEDLGTAYLTGDPISLSEGEVLTLSVTVEDGCTAGNPPFSGADLSFSASGGFEIISGNAFEVHDTPWYPIEYLIRVRATTDQTSEGELSLTIGSDEYTDEVIVTNFRWVVELNN